MTETVITDEDGNEIDFAIARLWDSVSVCNYDPCDALAEWRLDQGLPTVFLACPTHTIELVRQFILIHTPEAV